MSEFAVTKKQAELLREAWRRWNLRPHIPAYADEIYSKKSITRAWTGLGSATVYKPVHDAGLMEPVHELQHGTTIWWRLTEKGVLALIMLGWIEGDLDEKETRQATGGHAFGKT